MSVLRALSFVGAMALLPGANAMAQPAPPPPPLLGLPDGFLAEGPLPITVMISADVTSARAKKTEKGSLVLLTAKKLLYYADGNKTLQKHLASPVAGNVFLIETGDERKLKWKVDPETKLFTGEHVLPAPLLVKLPRKITPAQESLYLYFALEHLHGRVDEALLGGNEAQLTCSYRSRRARNGWPSVSRLSNLVTMCTSFMHASQSTSPSNRSSLEKPARWPRRTRTVPTS